MKISLVEDNQTMRGLLKTLLELEGYAVHICEEIDEQAIISDLLKRDAGLVLVDVHLSNANGMDIVKALKGKIGTSIKVIMTSGLPLKKECLKAGADYFLLKPFMPDDLLESIRGMIN